MLNTSVTHHRPNQKFGLSSTEFQSASDTSQTSDITHTHKTHSHTDPYTNTLTAVSHAPS
jgi:hypothetical protein